MEKHIVNSYDKDLNELRHSVINMANLVKELISIAEGAIKDPEQSFKQTADDTDLKINFHDDSAEQLAIHVLALRQPMAIDLRQVISALKLAVILERMGDLAKKASHRVEYLPIKIPSIIANLLLKMAQELEYLIGEAIKSYEALDDELAMEIRLKDKLIDDYYSQIMQLLEKAIENNPEQTKSFINLVLVVRNFERIGDYIIKIACITHYIITGEKLNK